MEPKINYVEVHLELNLKIEKNDLVDDVSSKEKIATYINRKLRTDYELLGKITEKNITQIIEK